MTRHQAQHACEQRLVVGRPLIVVSEILSRAGRDHCALVIFARKSLHCVDVGELGDGHELDFVIGGFSSHQVSAGIAPDAMNPG